ncbi:MAG: LacI family DNA-binding transcriptional regulator [Verrucomicrobia bacterium]|nr:LacI family DNA-binding transcriptional regulator [Verrucomicrobiota bacterium]
MSQPSMAEVARTLGVSKNTVSLALRGSPRVAAETRERIVQKAEMMGYRLNPTIAHLMAQLRQTRAPGYQATLAIINAHGTPDAFTRHATIPAYVDGCRRRARQLGYRLDEFWLHEPNLTVARWRSIFQARNIRGIIVVGLMQNNRLPSHMAGLWDEFPAVVTGVRTRDPALSFACSDHHALALEAFEKAIDLGYRRPALVLDRVIDDLIEGRFTAGFLTGQSRLSPAQPKTYPFYNIAAARIDPGVFSNWLKENQPDVIFTLYHEVKRWLLDLGLRVPGDIGLIQYEWRPDHADWSGMDQRNDLVGEAAVDMIISMIHHNQRGVPPQARATIIGPRWIEGGTSPRINNNG